MSFTLEGVNVDTIHVTATPRTEQAARDAHKLRTWAGRSSLLSQRMMEMERELTTLRLIVQQRHPIHDEGDGRCDLCDVLYPVGAEHE